MDPIRLVVEGKPLSVNAAYRVVRLGARAGMAKSPEAKVYQQRVQLAARKAMRGRAMLDGDLVLELVAYWPRRNADSDAATKLTKDALQGICFANDRIVVEDRSRKAHDPVRPRVEVLVYRDGERPRDLVNHWDDAHEGTGEPRRTLDTPHAGRAYHEGKP